MAPIAEHIPVASFSCPGCDCGACLSDAVEAVRRIDGVLHVRVDRTRKSLVVRYDEATVGSTEFRDRIRQAKLDPL
jgi:copper chaperone CopZ